MLTLVDIFPTAFGGKKSHSSYDIYKQTEEIAYENSIKI